MELRFRMSATVHGLEGDAAWLGDDPDHDVVGQSGRDLLPFREDVDGAALRRPDDVEHRDGGRDGDELDVPGDHDAEAPAAAAADRPEEVLAHGVPAEEVAPRVDQRGVHDVVDGEAVLALQHAEAAAAEVAADADGRADPRGEAEPRRAAPDGVVQLAERRAGLHPRRAARCVDAHRPHPRQVDDGEPLEATLGAVREPLVVVPAAARADADTMPAAADDGGLDVGGLLRHDDAQRRRRRGGVQEFRVSDGGLEDGCIGRGAPFVYEPW
ncbi:Os06g0549666, partial [Oryza sativa Japonica Group]